MHLGMIGLGRMGANMVRRLAAGGHRIAAYDVDPERAPGLAAELEGVRAAATPGELVAALPQPRTVWLMVPHEHVDETILALIDAGLGAGDVLVDGGNSNYRESINRAHRLEEFGVEFVDCGTSGGVWGLTHGYSLMLGGSDDALARLQPALETLAPAPDRGWGHVGPAGAGHFTKMVHNGIEYGLMQAWAEGMELLDARRDLVRDPGQVTRIWQHGSVVRSWLLDLIADALARDPELASLSDYVEDSGEGRWTVHEGIEQAVPLPVISLALQMRFRSRQRNTMAGRVLNALRAGFGGHPIRPAAGEEEDQ